MVVLNIETMANKEIKVPKVTRVEVIDETGRVYTKWNVKVEAQLQDDERTLKIFVYKKYD